MFRSWRTESQCISATQDLQGAGHLEETVKSSETKYICAVDCQGM